MKQSQYSVEQLNGTTQRNELNISADAPDWKLGVTEGMSCGWEKCCPMFWRLVSRLTLVVAALTLQASMSFAAGAVKLEQPLHLIPAGRWVKVHTQSPYDAVYFHRQAHGGSAFDTRRGRMVLFGSDTHGENWHNSPFFFDTGRLQWSRLYPDDAPSTYTVNAAGLPVAGEKRDHPWAMHTFDAVVYDVAQDRLMVSSLPKHLQPGRFTEVLAKVWPRVRHHPIWALDLASNKWTPLNAGDVHFFPYATAYDTHRDLIIGYRDSGIYELQRDPPIWRKVAGPGLLGYHNSAVYDSANRALVVFGSNSSSNDVVVYFPQSGRHQMMPTPGIRPPKDEHAPMAFHQRLGRTVVLADRPQPGASSHARDLARTETWLYDLRTDYWSQVPGASLPFGCGMNYNLEYDPTNDLLLLVTTEPGQSTSVWALRL